MKQAYRKKYRSLFLLTAYPALAMIIIGSQAKVTRANDLCGSGTGLCEIENRAFNVDAGDSYDTLDDNDKPRWLYVGKNGWGRLNINAGGKVQVVDSYAQIAHQTGSKGFIKVSGQDALFIVSNDLNVGVEGAGLLLVSDHAEVISNAAQDGFGGQIGLEGNGGYGAAVITTDGVWHAGDYLVIGRDENSNGSIVVNKNGKVITDNGHISLARMENSKGAIYIGAHSGEAPVTPGSLEADGIEFGHGDGYLVFNHSQDNNNYEFNPTLTGLGTIQNENGHTKLTGDNSDFSGNINLYGGVLSVGSKENLGSDDAALNFDGGTLHTDAVDFGSTDQDINIGAGGAKFDMDFNSNHSESMILAGDINGSGDLIKLGHGNLELSGHNSYGDTIIESGEIIGKADSISGDVIIANESTAAVTFDQNSDGIYTGDIHSLSSDANEIAANKTGSGSLTLTGVSDTGWYVEKGSLTSSAELLKGPIALENTGAIVFEQNHNASFANTISGQGTIQKIGPARLSITKDNSSFEGNTVVSEGTLALGSSPNAALGGNIDILSDAVLSGAGTVGTAHTGHITVHSGGSIAPGNSIGTLKVAGDLVFQAGSIYQVEVDPDGSTSDKIEVAGTAKLAGSVVHIGLDGEYKKQSSYTILTANNGIEGKFNEVASDFAFINPTLEYGANRVELTLSRNNIAFADYAVTPNQKSTADALESLPANSALLQKVELLPEDTSAAVFDGLSGEVHAGLITALHQNSSMTRSLALSHLRQNLSAGDRPGAPIAQASHLAVPTGAMPVSNALPLWVEFATAKQTIKGNNNTANIKQNINSIFLGGDTPIGNGWRLGGAFGYTKNKMHMDERDSTADIDTYTATAYGGKSFDLERARLNLLLGGSYSWHRIETSRSAYLNGWRHHLQSKYKANTAQLFGEMSYTMDFGPTSNIEPFAGLSWTRLGLDRLTESGGHTALSAGRHTQKNTHTALGVRLNTHLDWGKSTVNLQASLGWQHVFGSIHPTRTMAFSNSQDFRITGSPIARNSAALDLAAGFKLSKNAHLRFAYSGQFGGGNKFNSGSANLSWQF